MKKISLTPPDTWPPEAHELYRQFADKLKQKLANSRHYLRFLYHFYRYQQKLNLTYRDFPLEDLHRYLDSLTPRNRDQLMCALKAWLRFLFSRKELLWPIHEELVSNRYTARQRGPLSHAQILQILNLPNLEKPAGLRDRAFLEMAYATGMRKGELAALDCSDVDLAQGLVTIRQSKNAHQRVVPLTRWALHYLYLYLMEVRPKLTSPLSLNALWLGYGGRRLHFNQIGIRLKHLYRVEETLGFPATLHQFRHSVATHLLSAGAELVSVQALLGHLDIESTKIYTQITPTRLQEVHQRCHPRNDETIWPGDSSSARNSS